MSFENKVVLITGAGGGIGSAAAIHFASLKANLVLVDINKKALKETVELCETNTLSINVDLSMNKEVETVIPKTMKRFGRLDVLINNAAVSSKDNVNFLDDYDLIFNTNLRAPMLLVHLAEPFLIHTKGNIINVTSVGGIHPLPDLTMYNTSKAALRHFTKCVALKLAPKGVRVNAIALAAVKTEMVKSVGVKNVLEFERKRAKQLPLGRMIECAEVAELMAFLASDKARSITGTEYVIDAGHLLGGGTPRYSDDDDDDDDE